MFQISRLSTTTPEVLQQQWDSFERAYIQSTAATGAFKYQRLNDFRIGAYSSLQRDVQQRTEQKAQQELEAERQKLKQALQQSQQVRLVTESNACICCKLAD